MATPTICLLLKAPRSGFAKTRLTAQIGPHRALAVYRFFVNAQVAAIPAGWRRAISFAPADAEMEMRAWLGEEFRYFAQREGDLGERLAHAVDVLGATSAAPLFLVGGDCPSLDTSRLESAWDALRDSDTVIWPACDGGFVLLGLSRHQRGIFAGIAWSTPGVLRESCERIKTAGLACRVLGPPFEDVDDLASLERAQSRG